MALGYKSTTIHMLEVIGVVAPSMHDVNIPTGGGIGSEFWFCHLSNALREILVSVMFATKK